MPGLLGWIREESRRRHQQRHDEIQALLNARDEEIKWHRDGAAELRRSVERLEAEADGLRGQIEALELALQAERERRIASDERSQRLFQDASDLFHVLQDIEHEIDHYDSEAIPPRVLEWLAGLASRCRAAILAYHRKAEQGEGDDA